MEKALAYYERSLPLFLRTDPLAALRLAEIPWIPCKETPPLTPSEKETEEELWKSFNLQGIDLLCLYGISHPALYKKVLQWLNEDQKHFLRILDEDPQALLTLLHSEIGYELVSHPQVGLYWLEEGSCQHLAFTQLVWDFLRSSVRLCAGKALDEKKRIKLQQLHEELEILRAQAKVLAEEFFTYGVFYFENFYENLALLQTSFSADQLFGKFKGIPICVCGSGPSLEEEIETLRQLQDRAIILAAGSAVPILLSHGIQPHFGAAIDPTLSQAERLERQEKTPIPYFYRLRIHPRALRAISGPKLYVCGSGVYDAAFFIEQRLKLPSAEIDEGHNVLHFALSIAKALQAVPSSNAPIILLGADGAYQEGIEYSQGIPDSHRPQVKDKETLALRPDREGNLLITRKTWLAERAWLTEFAKHHANFPLINATSLGLPIKGMQEMALNEIAKDHFKKHYALSKLIATELESAHLPRNSSAKVKKQLQEWKEGLSRVFNAMEITKQHLKDANWPAALYTTTLWQEEEAYLAILAPFERLFLRIQRAEEMRGKMLDKQAQERLEQKLFEERLDFLYKGCKVHQKLLEETCSKSALFAK